MSRSTTNGKAECIQCGKSKSAVRCEGCLQTFCYNHLADHRQELSKQLDEIETDRDLFRQTLNLHTTSQQKHTLIQQIDHWKEESIQKIEQTADECKKSVVQYIIEQIQQVEINLSKLTEDLRYVRQQNDYNEADLLQLSTRLEQLTKELKQTENIVIERNSASPVNNITIVVSTPGKFGRCSNKSLFVENLLS
jgi:DNA repair exonuclease SbcCD ATPase subunit